MQDFANSSQSPPPPDAAERCWTVHDCGRQLGPHTQGELAAYVFAGTITPAALVWRAGMAGWAPITSIVATPAYPPPYALATPGPPGGYAGPSNSNKIPAGLCAIFLGALGVHKFMLGFNTAGIIMLLTTILTCGFGGMVMHVIGIIEGIIYLTKSDEQFHQEYVVNKKEWF